MRFHEDIALIIEVQQLTMEFQELRQTTKTVEEIIAKFRERVMLVPHYVADEEINKTRYHDLLRDDIKDFMSFSRCKTLNDMIARDPELEHRKKHNT